MARILTYTNKTTGEKTAFSTLTVLASHKKLPYKYDHMGDLLRDGKEVYEDQNIKIERLELIKK